VQARSGWVVATSAELAPNHPEKVLMVRREWAESNDGEHVALVAALLEACEFCDAPENRNEVIAVLARPEYVGVSTAALRAAFDDGFDFGQGQTRRLTDFNVFHRTGANEPSGEKAAWIIQHLRNSGLCKDAAALGFALGRQVFRADIFEKALRLRNSTNPKHEYQIHPKAELAHV
jgi:ABC-type nitrate/sulfonate/bicarbonate transport system substrate-binding protein